MDFSEARLFEGVNGPRRRIATNERQKRSRRRQHDQNRAPSKVLGQLCPPLPKGVRQDADFSWFVRQKDFLTYSINISHAQTKITKG